MIPVKFTVRERGATPRGFKKAYNAASKESWHEAGVYFHTHFRDQRFTHRHATAAGYTKRKRQYEMRKLKKYGHTRPLEFTGRTRRAVRAATISSTSSGAKVRYPGARVFNFRNPKSQVNMLLEFTSVTQEEANELAAHYDRKLDIGLNRNNDETR